MAVVRSCQDGVVEEALRRRGIECYSPVRVEKRKWSDRVKLVQRRVIPGIVFVHTDEKTRREQFGKIPYLLRYLSETRGSWKAAIVPDGEMQAFRMMVEKSIEPPQIVKEPPLQPGDRVKVISGPLKGLEAELVEVKGKTYVVAKLSILGAAAVQIDINSVEKHRDET